jgi:hypothetical protein
MPQFVLRNINPSKSYKGFFKLFLNPIFNNPMLKYDPNLNDMLEKE